MTRSREQTRKVEHLPLEISTPTQNQRKTEAQLVKILKSQTRKSPPPLNPVPRPNQVVNLAPVPRLNPASYLKERTKKISQSLRKLIPGSERGMKSHLRPLKKEEYLRWLSPIRASVGSRR